MSRRYIDKNTKVCSCCLKAKNIDCFYMRSDKRHLLQSQCKICVGTRVKDSVRRHRQRHSEQQKRYHQLNRKKRNEYNKDYAKRTLHIRRIKDRTRRVVDLDFRMSHNLRNRIRMALKRNSKSAATQTLIGCSIYSLKKHLENLFLPGMSWENYGDWQIDHIKPCSSFNLAENAQQLACFNFKNLQPLWKLDNLIKKNKIIEKEVYYR